MSEHEAIAFREITERFSDGQVVEIGGMNENPAFLANAEEISKYIDFWSAGTNDLTENAMGNIDRNDIQAKEHWMRANEQTGKDPTLSLCDLVKDELVSSKEAVGKELKSSICGQQVAGDVPSIQFAAEHGFGISVPPSYIEYTRLVVGQIACSKITNAGTPKNELGLKLQIS